jgi:outer membrane protein assembly factor BamB
VVKSTGSSQPKRHGRVPGRVAVGLFALACVVAGAAGGSTDSQLADRAANRHTASAEARTLVSGGGTAAAAADWPVYHLNAGRTGDYPSFPTFSGSLVAGWSAALDGAVYAEPLVVNGTIIAATEGDSVYALSPTSGAVLWRQNLGTPVPLSALPCGDINPLGITGTPAYDSVTGSLFAVAEVTGFHHILFALDPTTGAVRWSRDADLAGDDPSTHQQRPALAVANGYVYVGFGGLAGDCGQYVGEVVGVPATGQGSTISYRVPTAREGAVWATGGPVVDGAGNVYVSVGNGASTTTYDGTDSVLELSPTLQLQSQFAPTTWATDNANDADLGSLSPVLVPGGWVFIAGKSGTGYVLHQGALGGIGGQVSSATVCTGFGGASQSGGTIFVPCFGSLREVQVGMADGSLTPGWQSAAAGGPPVLGGGVVWSINISSGRLVALDPATGATLGSIAVGAVPHFVSPTLWQNQVLVGTMAGISSVSVPSVPPVSSTFHAVTPARVLDTRSGLGLAGPFSSHVARTFAVAGHGGVPAGASAVTGNLTVTGQTSKGYLFIGPVALNNPTSSSLNFPVGDDRANGVTVALGDGANAPSGSLSVTYVGSAPGTAQAIFDVTGYFTPDMTGSTYHPLDPSRVLDTRSGTGLPVALTSHIAQTFGVTGGVVPAGAVAVTGNLTVTQQSRSGFLFIGPVANDDPTSSTLNFPVGDDRANGVTLALGDGINSPLGTLSVTYVGSAPGMAQVIFDVTGYFTPDASGARFVPLAPARLLDTRNGTGGIFGPIASHMARPFQVTGGVVPSGATAAAGSLTVTGQSSRGFLFIGPNPTDNPTSSTLNFPLGDDRADGLTVGLGAGGTLSVTLVSPSPGQSAQVVFDVTGYFSP